MVAVLHRPGLTTEDAVTQLDSVITIVEASW